MRTRGFITIATGKAEYYWLAFNLVRSYRFFSEKPLPFAILCDRKNSYTSIFNDVIVFEDGATNSYLDKLRMEKYLPYDETIFIDSDCLAYGDLNQMFSYFENAGDFSCFGRVLPLDDKTGWFEYENLGKYQSDVKYIVGLHGGIYFMRKTEVTKRVFQQAEALIPEYKSFKFKGKFDTPGDEPIVALSMALNGCKPIPFVKEAICCYWEHENSITIDITKKEARTWENPSVNINLLHWGTRYTRELLYKREVALLELLLSDEAHNSWKIRYCRLSYYLRKMFYGIYKFICRVVNKLKRITGLK